MNQQPTAASLILDSAKWVWDNYGEGFSEWLKEKAEDKAKEKGLEVAQNRWKTFQWQRAEKEYREKLAKLYGTTRILGNSEPTPLEGIFTDLYILDKPLAMRRYSLDDLQASDEKLRGHELQRCEGIEVVKRSNSHRLFILGKPGAGKTTFLKYITLQAVKGELPQTPIFVGLREWSEAKKKQNDKEIDLTLMEFIVEQFAICNFPKADSFIEYLLEKGKAILLLDGLDEVNNEHHNKVTNAVKKLCRQYDKTQCLITCRVASVDYSFESFKYMEVADFTDAQIETFVKKWFVNEPIKCEKFLTEFKQEQYRGLRELASSPLLLGMLCLAFADSMEFSTRRAEIYEDAINALLRKWDKDREITRDVIYKDLTHQLKNRVFSAIAYKTFSDNEYLIKEKELSDYLSFCLKKLPNVTATEIDGESILKAIEAQHGIFVERAQKVHSFAHLTFQEYFAACAIKGNLNYQKELMKHIADNRYREVFLLTVSLLDDGDNFFELFRNSIDNLVRQDEKIIELLRWAKLKENNIQDDGNLPEIRFFYTVLNSNIFLNAIGNYEYNFIPSLLISQNINYRINGFSSRELNSEFNKMLQICRLGVSPYSKDMAVDYLLNMILIYRKRFEVHIHQDFISLYEKLIKEVSQLNFSFIACLLRKLKNKIPNDTASRNEWVLFFDKIIQISKNHRNIETGWGFTTKQIVLLNNYFLANKLLLDCLKLATVSDREAIKNSLFLPPANSAN